MVLAANNGYSTSEGNLEYYIYYQSCILPTHYEEYITEKKAQGVLTPVQITNAEANLSLAAAADVLKGFTTPTFT